MNVSSGMLHLSTTHLPVVSNHVMSSTLSGGGWVAVLLFWLGIAAVASFFKERSEKRRKALGLPPKTPRQPMDISPGTASLLSGQSERGYKPRGITAITPSGIRVTVRCPHRSGHRSPDLAVACAEREKARIERTGR
jgi:hypothetical protein